MALPPILLLCSDPLAHTHLARLLEEAGFSLCHESWGIPLSKEEAPAAILAEIPRDAQPVLQRLGQLRAWLGPRVPLILFTAFESPQLPAGVRALGACTCLVQPLDYRYLVYRLAQLLRAQPPASALAAAANPDAAIAQQLQALGIPPRLLGYRYLCAAISLALQEPEMLHFVTKQLYPAVAQRFNSTPARVERSIRHAIAAMWVHRSPHLLAEILPALSIRPGQRPTNLEFIRALCCRLTPPGNPG